METEQTSLAHELLHMVLWLLSVALLVLDLWLVANATNALLVGMGARRQIVDLVWYSSMLILGCLGVACAVATEYFFRRSRAMALLLKRGLTVLGIELAVGIVASLVRYLVVVSV